AGQPLEEALVDDTDIDVEAREPQRCTGDIDEGRDPTGLAHVLQRPHVNDQRRRGTKGDHVGQAVHLLTEGGLGVGHPRDAAIQ
ncbi:hypothetical protein EV21_15185, partial [Staphylococcus aureus]